MLTCPFGTFAAGRSLNCDSADGMLFFDDTASLEEKVRSASAHHLGGITYWNVGDEPAGFFAMVRRYFWPVIAARPARASLSTRPRCCAPLGRRRS